MKLKNLTHSYKFLLSIIVAVALSLRIINIDFGLPQYTHNDEADIVEPAITASFNVKNIIRGEIQHLKPNDYNFGTTPAYLLAPVLAVSDKILNLTGHQFIKADLYIISRYFWASLGTLGTILIYIFSKNVTKKQAVALIAALVFALNWKLVVFSHFVNPDLVLMLTFVCFYIFGILYEETSKTKWAILAGISLGLGVGTKITSVIAIPAFMYLSYTKRDYKNLIYFFGFMGIAFLISNPFTILDFQNFFARINEMTSKEAGLVFSSADKSILKYFDALAFITTPIALSFTIYGMFESFKNKLIENKTNIFLIVNLAIFILFFSLVNKRTDRYLIPLLPIIFMYSAIGIYKIREFFTSKIFYLIMVITAASYVYPTAVANMQFKEIPKQSAYYWIKEYTTNETKILIVSDTDNTPYTFDENILVYNIKKYVTSGAHKQVPPDTREHEYIITLSKPLSYYKNKYVVEEYPLYAEAWKKFEDTLNDSTNFEVVEKYELTGLNIVTFSEVTIYRNLNYNVKGCGCRQ